MQPWNSPAVHAFASVVMLLTMRMYPACWPMSSLKECVTNPCGSALQPGKVKSHSAQFWREADMLASLNHPSVLHLYGVVVDNHHERNVVGIMTEYMRGGSLSAALR